MSGTSFNITKDTKAKTDVTIRLKANCFIFLHKPYISIKAINKNIKNNEGKYQYKEYGKIYISQISDSEVSVFVPGVKY